MTQSKNALWTRDFIIVSSVQFFLALVFFLLMVSIGIYAVEEFDATTGQAGIVTGIFIIGILIGRLFIGRFIDAIGRKRTMFLGLIFFTVTTLLYFINVSFSFLLINRLVHGMAFGMASTATGTIVAQIIPVSRKGEGIGYYTMSSALATAIGPFIGLLMIQHASYPIIFGFCLMLGAISLIISLFVRVPTLSPLPKLEEAPIGQKKVKFKISNFIEPKVVPIAIVILVLGFCYSSVLTFISFYSIEIDLVDAASFFFVVYAVVVLLSRPFAGRLLDSKGANFIMYPSFIAFGVGMLVLSLAGNSSTLLLAGALLGLGYGNLTSSAQAIAIKLSPPHRLGLATSTFYIALDAGLGFGPYFLGSLIPIFGYSNLYIIMAVIILATSILYYFLYGKKEKKEQAAAKA